MEPEKTRKKAVCESVFVNQDYILYVTVSIRVRECSQMEDRAGGDAVRRRGP